MFRKKFMNLKDGTLMKVRDYKGKQHRVIFHIGDALLHGNGAQFWFSTESKPCYVRLFPETGGELGMALFFQRKKAFEIIYKHQFYVG